MAKSKCPVVDEDGNTIQAAAINGNDGVSNITKNLVYISKLQSLSFGYCGLAAGKPAVPVSP